MKTILAAVMLFAFAVSGVKGAGHKSTESGQKISRACEKRPSPSASIISSRLATASRSQLRSAYIINRIEANGLSHCSALRQVVACSPRKGARAV